MAGAPEGILLVDKPSGMTSHDVVVAERRALGTRKIGHAGTLDPIATGLLVLGVGRATRLLRYLGDLDKTYTGVARLGEVTDTLDADGAIVRTTAVSASRADVERACASLVGEHMQTPPAYSAVKVGGRKLYEAARAGETLIAPPRRVRVDAFDVSGFDGRDFTFRIVCTGGTYVRVLVADVGRSLGTGAHVRALRRAAIGPLTVEDAHAPGEAELLRVERAVAHLPRVELEPGEARAASNGSILGPAGIDGPYGVYDRGGRLIGVYRDEAAKARPEVVLAPAGATSAGEM